jgi:hypothetical protein
MSLTKNLKDLRIAALRFFGLALILGSCKEPARPKPSSTWDPNPAFWVWNQTSSPPPTNGHFHYLQVAEFTSDSFRELQAGPLGKGVTAVVRLPPGRQAVTDPVFQNRLFSYLKKRNFPRLQLDYDCASLNLGLYRQFLESLQTQVTSDHLSITALASWIEAPGFDDVAMVVDEVAPMFYDLEPDKPSQIQKHSCEPLIDERTLDWIKKWKGCPVTWRAGLPNYQRLSLFHTDGTLVGHLSRWQPSDLKALPGLTPLEGSSSNHYFLRIDRDQEYQNIQLPKGHLLVWRRPDEAMTKKAITTARDAGAGGVIWFTHPQSTPVASHSVNHLTQLQTERSPQAKLETTLNPDGSVTLTNTGSGDLSFSAEQPYRQLVLEAKTHRVFSSPNPGTFHSVQAPGSSLVRPELARTIVLTFSDLGSGSSLTSAPRLFDPTKQQLITSRILPSP